MKANRAKNTKPEILLRKYLWQSGARGYRINWKRVAGSPDISYPGKKIAIFVHGCFWHRCPHCNLKLPKTNTDFWNRKFQNNIERDKIKEERLKYAGWRVITTWECEIKKNPDKAVTKIIKMLEEKENIVFD